MGCFCASGFFLLCRREMLQNLSFLAWRAWILISKLLYEFQVMSASLTFYDIL